MALLVVSVMPMVLAASVASGVGVDITTEDFAPMVWMCDNRIAYDDNTEPGRITSPFHGKCTDINGVVSYPTQANCVKNGGVWDSELFERTNNYAFEGEQIHWSVLVLDKNGLDKVKDVFGTIGDSQGAGNDIEVNCQLVDMGPESGVPESCNAYIGEEKVDEENFDNWEHIAGIYDCTLTVETGDSMYGEYWITVEAEDLDGLSGTMAENEYWFLNPIIALDVAKGGSIAFEDVRPGTLSYSDTVLVGNDADSGSGVMMDMFISGTDFYDSSSSGAMCPISNQLELSNFAYYATNGAYSTSNDPRNDDEGYVPIRYGIAFNDPNPFYGNNEIIQGTVYNPKTEYTPGNVLSPGSEIALTFRLDLPEPCNGDFDTGSIYFFGEAI